MCLRDGKNGAENEVQAQQRAFVAGADAAEEGVQQRQDAQAQQATAQQQ